MNVHVEVRRRLGVAYLIIRDIPVIFQGGNLDLDGKGIKITPKNDESASITLEWPRKMPKLPCPQSLTLPLQQSELCHRLSIVRDGQVQIMGDKDKGENKFLDLSNWSKSYVRPVSVSSRAVEEKRGGVHCSNCLTRLSVDSFAPKRCLPLPCLTWNDGSVLWFCGCYPKGFKDDETKPVSNRNLPAQALSPRNGDVLFAPGVVVMNESDLETNEAVARTSQDVLPSEICCVKCEHTVGMQLKKESVQLWDHAVFVCVEEELASRRVVRPAQTVCDVVQGCISESPTGAARIYFVDGKEGIIEVWVTEQDVEYFSSTDLCPSLPSRWTNDDGVPIVKFMYKTLTLEEPRKSDLSTHEIRINPSMLEDALRLFRSRELIRQAGGEAYRVSSIVKRDFAEEEFLFCDKKGDRRTVELMAGLNV